MTVHVDRSLRLPESEYFAHPQTKSGIAIHHTVGGSARSTLEAWRVDRSTAGRPRLVGTAYIIDHDGTVLEVFDPTGWAYQFGLRWPHAARLRFEQRFIGIELASEGALIEHEGELYCFDRVSPRTWKSEWEAFDYGREYRGYRWFDRYAPEQLEALAGLVDELCTRFAIPRQYPAPAFDYYGDALAGFEGVIGHAMVRPDKSDPAPNQHLWWMLGEFAAVRPTVVTPPARANGAAPLSSGEIEALFAENARRIDQMDVAAGSLVKALIMELERRRTYLRLDQPEPGAHGIGYEVARGDRRQVLRLARALGFANATDRLLEVRHA